MLLSACEDMVNKNEAEFRAITQLDLISWFFSAKSLSPDMFPTHEVESRGQQPLCRLLRRHRALPPHLLLHMAQSPPDILPKFALTRS